MRETSYDVVLYGASGFVGKQTVRYFAERAGNEDIDSDAYLCPDWF